MNLLNIHLIAPSGYPLDPDSAKRAVKRLQAAGHTLANLSCLERRAQRFAGSDAERIAELNALADLPESIGLVLAVRGGYGLNRLLPHLNLPSLAARIRRTGLKLMGHSDFTALQLALLAHGASTLAGPMLIYDFGAEQTSLFTQRYLDAAIAGQGSHIEMEIAGNPEVEVSGTLWGGNLAMLCSLIGTPWLPRVHGGILFVEDINEHPYRVERMLLQLLHAGVLANQQALVLGDFSDYKLSDYDNGYDMSAMVDWFRKQCPIPVLTGLPFGHCRDKVTLPVGGSAKVRSTLQRWWLDF